MKYSELTKSQYSIVSGLTERIEGMTGCFDANWNGWNYSDLVKIAQAVGIKEIKHLPQAIAFEPLIYG